MKKCPDLGMIGIIVARASSLRATAGGISRITSLLSEHTSCQKTKMPHWPQRLPLFSFTPWKFY